MLSWSKVPLFVYPTNCIALINIKFILETIIQKFNGREHWLQINLNNILRILSPVSGEIRARISYSHKKKHIQTKQEVIVD